MKISFQKKIVLNDEKCIFQLKKNKIYWKIHIFFLKFLKLFRIFTERKFELKIEKIFFFSKKQIKK